MADNLTLIGQGSILEIKSLSQFENQLEEGAKAELRLFTRVSVPDSVLQTLQSLIQRAGVPLWDDVKQVSRVISIRFEKHSAPIGIILAIVLGLVVLFALIVSWQILKLVSSNSSVWLLVGGVILLGILAVGKMSKEKAAMRRATW